MVAGRRRLLLGEPKQLLSDGLDQGGRGVGGRAGVRGLRERGVAQPRGVLVGRGRRGLPAAVPGHPILAGALSRVVVVMVMAPADHAVLSPRAPADPTGQTHLSQVVQLGACSAPYWSRPGRQGLVLSVEALA